MIQMTMDIHRRDHHKTFGVYLLFLTLEMIPSTNSEYLFIYLQ
jgi:hypothetical protein